MAEQPVVYQVDKIEGENGKNAEELIGFQQQPNSTIFQGTASALSPVMVQLGMIDAARRPNIKYSFDDFANAIASGDTILTRRNRRGQTVPKRWYEYGEDRQDIVTGVFADYIGAPLLNIIGYWMAGRDENIKDANEFIYGLHQKYSINPNLENNFIEHEIEHNRRGVPITDTLKPERGKDFEIGYYKRNPDGTDELIGCMKATQPVPISEWPKEHFVHNENSNNSVWWSGALVRRVESFYDPTIRRDK